ncbi:ABC transporter substrate-binding protein [Endozoicomonas arenosclerae]|uniref:ABC transporter substrate-binding protein n=1 Tax=Endozoicomonas arenosclerae TaxID=1633495 RepID=UPI000AEAD65F|nr:ABC transporter substrate-binding protein [Endozoicomonas arenosclerae]
MFLRTLIRKSASLLSIILTSTLFLTAAPAMAEEKSKELKLMLEWFVNPDHGPIIIAQENGYFKDQGLEVDIQEPADPNLPPKLVAAGDVDLAVYYQPSLIHGVANGLPLAWAGTLIATPLDGLIVLKDGPIKSLKDMKGKTIGLNMGGNENAILDTLFKPYGFSSKDIKMVNVGWNMSSSLMSGRVDAIMGAYRNFELNQLDIEGRQGKMFYYEENGIPSYDELIFIANSKKNDKEAIRKFLRAIELGTQFIVNNPEESWKIFRDYNPENLDNELNKRAWFDTVPRFTLRPAAKDTGRYDRFAKFLDAHGDLKNIPPAKDYMLNL